MCILYRWLNKFVKWIWCLNNVFFSRCHQFRLLHPAPQISSRWGASKLAPDITPYWPLTSCWQTEKERSRVRFCIFLWCFFLSVPDLNSPMQLPTCWKTPPTHILCSRNCINNWNKWPCCWPFMQEGLSWSGPVWASGSRLLGINVGYQREAGREHEDWTELEQQVEELWFAERLW